MRNCIWIILICVFLPLGCKRKEYATGEAVFREECLRCHKIDSGQQGKGPDFTTILAKRSEDYFRRYTYDPRSIKTDSVMPAVELSEKEMNLLLQYLQQKVKRVEK